MLQFVKNPFRIFNAYTTYGTNVGYQILRKVLGIVLLQEGRAEGVESEVEVLAPLPQAEMTMGLNFLDPSSWICGIISIANHPANKLMHKLSRSQIVIEGIGSGEVVG